MLPLKNLFESNSDIPELPPLPQPLNLAPILGLIGAAGVLLWLVLSPDRQIIYAAVRSVAPRRVAILVTSLIVLAYVIFLLFGREKGSRTGP